MTRKYPDPKRLDYSRPQFWQSWSRDYPERVRIISLESPPSWAGEGYLQVCGDDWASGPPCWYRRGMTPRQQVAAMKAYDKREGRTTIFLGYLA